jgi:hypothetical protein
MAADEPGFFFREFHELSLDQFVNIGEMAANFVSYPCPSVFIRG